MTLLTSKTRGAERVILAMLAFVLCSATFLQGQTGSVAPVNRTEIVLLGTNAGPPLRLDRSEPSTLLIVDGRPYLIDCGIGTIHRMMEAHVASQDIRTIFLTHLHADHDLGLADVMANDFVEQDKTGTPQTISIYGPPQTKDLVDAAFHYITFGFRAFAAEAGGFRPLLNGEFRSQFVGHEIPADGLVYQDDKIRVTAAENNHFALMPEPARKLMKSYSYRIETPHGVVVFTGDTGPSDAVTQLAKGADVLVTEVLDLDEVQKIVNGVATQNHWAPERAAAMLAHMREEHLVEAEVGDMATKAQVKSLLLDHYSAATPAASVPKVKAHFSGPIFAPADLDRYCLEAGNKNSGSGLRRCGNLMR